MRNCLTATAWIISWAPLLAWGQGSLASDVSKELPTLEHLSASQVNPEISPCSDFYQYTCSRFVAANPIPPDRVAWGVAGPLQKWNEMVLREALVAAASRKEGRSVVEQKLGEFWIGCTDENAIEATALNTLQRELKQINGIKEKSQLADEVAHLHLTIAGAWEAGDVSTFAGLFGFGSSPDFDDVTQTVAALDQGGFVLPGRNFYLSDDSKSVEIRKDYQGHIANMLKLAGETEAQAADASVILEIETRMAKSAMDMVQRRDPKNLNNKMSLEQIQQLTPSFNWKRYLALVQAPESPHYLVTAPNFFRGLEQLLQQQPLEHWKAYLRWQLVHGSARFLGRAFVAADFSFMRNLTGATELPVRWRRCVQDADYFMGEALGQAYVKRAFPPDNKEKVLEMVRAIEAALDQDITEINWMTLETKGQAKAKLHLILDKIGYPDHWRDYSALQIIPGDYLDNVHRATTFEFERQLQKIGKKVDRQEWQMTPPRIDAYYDPQTNTINFPAGILHLPFFDNDQDNAANYGAEGAVIGHEITHGFDDQGRQFDGNGNLHDWWTVKDAENFRLRSKCISDQYTQEIPEAGVKQDGLLTEGEDIADNGGVRLALIALTNTLNQKGKSLDSKGPDGLTELQRFFLAYANSWCGQFRPETMRTQVLSNPHSLPKYRVNNVLANVPEFATAFGCKKGQPMVRENVCRVW